MVVTIPVIQFIADSPVFNYGVTLVLAPTLIAAVPFFYLYFIKRG
jgi:hypothetical protein